LYNSFLAIGIAQDGHLVNLDLLPISDAFFAIVSFFSG